MLRGGVALAVVLLSLWLGYSLWSPFAHARPDLVILQSPQYSSLDALLVPFAEQQQAALSELAPALHQETDRPSPTVVEALRADNQLLALGDRLVDDPSVSVLVAYVAAHGVVVDGQPCLLSEDYRASPSTAGRVPVSALFDQLQRSPAATKLLIIDSGPLQTNARLGVAFNDFAALLQEEAEKRNRSRRGPGTIWVLHSHARFERSHYARSLQRSVFGFFVERGLRGAADLDLNHEVDLGELHRFVVKQVAAWVSKASGDRESQTPWLAPPLPADSPAPVLISTGAFPKSEQSLDIAAAVSRAQEGSRTFAYYVGTRDLLNTSSLAYSVASLAPAPLARFGFGSPLANMLGQAASSSSSSPTASPANEGEAAATTAGAGGKPPLEDAGTATNGKPAANVPASTGEPQDATTPESDPAKPSSAAKAKAPATDPIPDLLRKGWMLRDQLLEMDVYGGHSAVAPTSVRRYEATLIGIEQTYRMGQFEPRLLLRKLRQLIEPLELMTQPAASTKWSRRQQLLVDEWRGSVLPTGIPHSLGFARALSQSRPDFAFLESANLSAALEKFVAKESTRVEFDDWIAGLSAAEQAYAEVRLAARLATVAGLSWPQLQQALRSALLAETVASSPPRFLRGFLDEIERADRIRARAEFALLEPLSTADRLGAERLFQDAIRRYERIASEIQSVAEASRLSVVLSHRAPQYLAWRRAAGQPTLETPTFQDLGRLFDAWRNLISLLESDDSADRVERIRRLTSRTRKLQQSVERQLDDDRLQRLLESSDSTYAIEDLLRIPLTDAGTRDRLLWAADASDISAALAYQSPPLSGPIPMASQSWRRLDWAQEQMRLELELTEIATLQCPEARKAFKNVVSLSSRLDESPEQPAAFRARQDPRQVQANFAELGPRIGGILSRAGDVDCRCGAERQRCPFD